MQSPSKIIKTVLAISIVIVVSGFSAYFVYTFFIHKTGSKISKELKSTTTDSSSDISTLPTPTPKALSQGKVPFDISSGKKTGPQTTRGFIDPYDPKNGDKQTIHTEVMSKKPIKSFIITMKTDNGKIEYPASKVSGTDELGEWEASWVTADTHDKIYNAILTISDDLDTNSVTLTLRP